jgi:hypothetical protein
VHRPLLALYLARGGDAERYAGTVEHVASVDLQTQPRVESRSDPSHGMHGTKAITGTIPSGCLHTLRGQKAQQAAAQLGGRSPGGPFWAPFCQSDRGKDHKRKGSKLYRALHAARLEAPVVA